MKNKMRFIMPRLVGATMVVGLLALFIGILFKLMLGLVLIASLITLISHKISRRRHDWMSNYAGNELQGLGKMNVLGNNGIWVNQMPSFTNTKQKSTTIIPIN